MNQQLIKDEASRNPMSLSDLERRMQNWLDGDWKAIVVERNGSDPGTMPWPLMRGEFAAFNSCGLREVMFEDYVDDENPPVRRFRVEYRRSL